MLDDPNKPDDSLDATARDYLGKPSPLAFKNQPALPSGGGSIGVGAGPNTTAGGTGASGVRRSASFAEMLQSLGLSDPAAGGGDAGGGTGGGPGVTGPSEGNVTGFDSGLVSTALTTAGLAMGVPGAVGLVSGLATGMPAATGVPSLATAVPSLGKVANSLFGEHSNLTTPSGAPVAALKTGLIDSVVNAAQGHANFATSSDPAVAAMIAQNPALLSDPTFMAAPLSDGRTVSDTISPVDNSLSPGVAMNPGTFGATNMPGQVGFAGAPGGPNMAEGGTGAPSNSGYGGYSGQSGNPNAPGAITFGGQNRGDEGNAGASGGGGDSHICGALRRRGLLDTPTLRANARFRRTMSAQEYAGYDRWARPLVAWAEARPWRARVLLAAGGWLVRAYMAEIARPGSSRLGRGLLAVGLRVCARLGRDAQYRKPILA